MVTETINNEDISPFNRSIEVWIRDGITEDAVWCLIEKWKYIYKEKSDECVVRNLKWCNQEYIIQPSKW